MKTRSLTQKFLVGMLKCIAALPLRGLYLVSDFLFFFVFYVVRYRRKVVRRNLREAFPEKSEKEIGKIEKEFFHYMCDVIVETVKLLHISDTELARRVELKEFDAVRESLEEGKNVVLLLGHYNNWEWVQEMSRAIDGPTFKASIYHPLKDKTWDGVYKEIRSRWGLHIIPQRQAVKTLLNRQHQPWICGFIADNRPDTIHPDSITPFLNHYTSFIYGPEVIGAKVGADFFFLKMERLKRGFYRLEFRKLSPMDDGRPFPYTRRFWSEFEKVIKEKPAYWLWSHKRWKRDKLISD